MAHFDSIESVPPGKLRDKLVAAMKADDAERVAARRKRAPASASRQGKPWDAADVAVLREAYAAFPPPQHLPMQSLESLLGRSGSSIRTKAVKLGLTNGPRRDGRPRTLEDATCPACGTVFRRDWRKVQYCSASCGQTGKWDRNEHPRGMLGKNHTAETRDRMADATRAAWENPKRRADGEAHLDEIRDRAIAARRAAPEAQFTRARGGRRADLDQYFRSSWEANYARYLNWLVAHADLVRWEYEPQTFEFPVKRGTKFYTPDFRLTFADGRQEWHEVKGWLTQQGATALKRFRRHYPDEVLVVIDGDAYKAIAGTARPLIPEWE